MECSFAAILGGTCTLIGTSTNLIVVGLAQQDDPNFSLNFFEIAIIGTYALLHCSLAFLYPAPCSSHALPSPFAPSRTRQPAIQAFR